MIFLLMTGFVVQGHILLFYCIFDHKCRLGGIGNWLSIHKNVCYLFKKKHLTCIFFIIYFVYYRVDFSLVFAEMVIWSVCLKREVHLYFFFAPFHQSFDPLFTFTSIFPGKKCFHLRGSAVHSSEVAHWADWMLDRSEPQIHMYKERGRLGGWRLQIPRVSFFFLSFWLFSRFFPDFFKWQNTCL